MKTRLISKLVLTLIALALPLTAAKADVNLVWVPLSVSAISPGTTTTIELRIQITGAEQLRGVDFLLQSLDLSPGFYIASRSLTGSALPDATNSNGDVANAGEFFGPAGADNALNPANDVPLTQQLDFASDPSLTSVGMPVNGWLVATYTFGVNAGVAPGSYTIGYPVGLPTWSDQNGDDHAPTIAGTFELVVVPEPATWSLFALGGLGAFGLNLLRAKRKS